MCPSRRSSTGIPSAKSDPVGFDCAVLMLTSYAPSEIGIDAFQADRSPTHMYPRR
jgi:hypothetical protein